jgi:hypothetical protein
MIVKWLTEWKEEVPETKNQGQEVKHTKDRENPLFSSLLSSLPLSSTYLNLRYVHVISHLSQSLSLSLSPLFFFSLHFIFTVSLF